MDNFDFVDATKIEHIDVSKRTVYRDVPAINSPLTRLIHLNISEGQFGNRIPDSWTEDKFPVIDVFDISRNALWGTNEFELGPLVGRVSVFNIYDTYINGDLSILDRASDKLIVFDVGKTRLSGGFPYSLRSAVNLEYLDISDTTSITNGIPNWFNELPKLQYLMISRPTWVRSSWPSSILSLTGLKGLRIEGELYDPPSFDVFQVFHHLELLDLTLTRVSGSLPDDLPNWFPNMTYMALSTVSLSTYIPESIGQMKKLVYFEKKYNNQEPFVQLPKTMGNLTNLISRELIEGDIQYRQL